jgi:hypothetical protein
VQQHEPGREPGVAHLGAVPVQIGHT